VYYIQWVQITTHVLKKFSKVSATLSPTASFTRGISEFWILGLFFFLAFTAPGTSDGTSSRVKASVVRRCGVCARGSEYGSDGALEGSESSNGGGEES